MDIFELDLRDAYGKHGPLIRFSPTGDFLLLGQCIMENPLQFYTPAQEWLKSYIATADTDIQFDVLCWTFNTSGWMHMCMLLETLNGYAKLKGKKVALQWHIQLYDAVNEENIIEVMEELPFLISNTKIIDPADWNFAESRWKKERE